METFQELTRDPRQGVRPENRVGLQIEGLPGLCSLNDPGWHVDAFHKRGEEDKEREAQVIRCGQSVPGSSGLFPVPSVIVAPEM